MGRGKAWSLEEDIGLCRAYVRAASENGREDIFPRMREHFLGLAPETPAAAGGGDELQRWRQRSERAMKKRFLIMRSSVLQFCRYFAKFASAGGVSEDRAIAAALEEYQAACHQHADKPAEHKDNAFKYLHAWRILRHAPHFREVCESGHVLLSTPNERVTGGGVDSVLNVVGGIGDVGASGSSPAHPGVDRKRQRTEEDEGSGPPIMMQTSGHVATPVGLTTALSGLGGLPSGSGLPTSTPSAGGALGAGAAREAAGGENASALAAQLGRVADVGERLVQVAEDLVGVLMFQRQGANDERRSEYFRLAEERQLAKLRRTVAAERDAMAAVGGGLGNGTR